MGTTTMAVDDCGVMGTTTMAVDDCCLGSVVVGVGAAEIGASKGTVDEAGGVLLGGIGIAEEETKIGRRGAEGGIVEPAVLEVRDEDAGALPAGAVG
jgi:hypothetical protein